MLGFLGVTAVAGGIELAFGVWGAAAFPADWLDGIPLIDSWLIPGLVLGIGFGFGSLFTGYGMIRRTRRPWLASAERWTGHHWSWLATVLIGAGHIVWIALELIFIPELSWLEVIYGGVGLALLILPMTPPVRRNLATNTTGARTR